jgi:hypothetical protein
MAEEGTGMEKCPIQEKVSLFYVRETSEEHGTNHQAWAE